MQELPTGQMRIDVFFFSTEAEGGVNQAKPWHNIMYIFLNGRQNQLQYITENCF